MVYYKVTRQTTTMNNLERMTIKGSHLIRHLLRRYLWLKLLVCSFVFIFVIKIMSLNTRKSTNEPKLLTLYEYYNVRNGHSNVGLDDNNPITFKLNGKDIWITSGTIHYFRVHPDYWRDRLRKLRALGAVAVETYVPWNLHEPEKNVFDFGDKNYEMSKFMDIVKFLTIAKEEDLFVILRPGPYICAEWEFGGLPSYLLNLGVQLRTNDKLYMERVEMYLKQLIQRVAPFQVYNGGPIIMVQVENEYGTLNDFDHEYMVALKKIMVDEGLKGLFFTADSPIPYGSRGSLAEQGVLQTANFKLDGQMQMETLREIQPNKPLMVMEFWTGWFDHWDELVHNTWSTKIFITALKEVLDFPACVNLYVFHGGTTFGFLNGANMNHDGNPEGYHPDTTSYDYDALLTESGDYTEKYFQTRELFLPLYKNLGVNQPDPPQEVPRVLKLTSKVTQELNWVQISSQIPPSSQDNSYANFVHMEDLPHETGTEEGYGFVRYVQKINVKSTNPTLQIFGPIRDILIVMVDGIRQTDVLHDPDQLNDFGFWNSRNSTLILQVPPGLHTLEYIVENCGRINYVKSLSDFPKKKGLGPENSQVFTNAEVEGSIQATRLPFSSKWITSLTGWIQTSKNIETFSPSLFKTTFNIASKDLSDTYLDIREWKKGIVYVNGFNIGRYFSGGPQLTLYIPAPLLRVGENTIIIFDQYTNPGEIRLVTDQIFM